MKALMTWFAKKGMPQECLAELAEFVKQVQHADSLALALVGTAIGLETVLEHHGLITPAILEACRPALEAKMTGGEPPVQGEPNPALAPTSVDRPGTEQGSGQ